MTERQIPTYADLLWPTLKALEHLGGSASVQELFDQVANNLALTEEVLTAPHNKGPRSKVGYNGAWARTHLKHIGAVDNTSRGVWTITESGRRIQSEEKVRELIRQRRAEFNRERQAPNSESEIEGGEEDWKEALLEIIRRLEPDEFERLCQRMLRESGFTKVEVKGRSGDGGIDGTGVLRVNLISFHVFFQCKKWAGSVGAREIRDFRGAIVGRTDKGLFITTGLFTKDAEREAIRDGAPAIDLINGNGLCDLLRKLKLGVSSETVEVVRPIPEFFEVL